MRFAWIVLLASCAVGQWESPTAENPVSPRELSYLRTTVYGPQELAVAMAQQGFDVVSHAPYKGDLALVYEDGVGTLRSDGFFVDEVRGDPNQVALQLAHSQRVADFVRNSGTVQQRDVIKGL
jgi:hypothetical protein